MREVGRWEQAGRERRQQLNLKSEEGRRKAQGRTLREVDEEVIAAEGLYSWDSRGRIKARGDFSEHLGHPLILQKGKLRPESLNSSQLLAPHTSMANKN